MSAITPHYRNVQQLLQSQSYSINDLLLDSHVKVVCRFKGRNKDRALKVSMMQKILTKKARLP